SLALRSRSSRATEPVRAGPTARAAHDANQWWRPFAGAAAVFGLSAFARSPACRTSNLFQHTENAVVSPRQRGSPRRAGAYSLLGNGDDQVGTGSEDCRREPASRPARRGANR